jgi:uncharacterized protein (DUF433 family)
MKGSAMRKALKTAETGHSHIAIKRGVCGGKPVIRGTRVSVASIAAFYLMGFGPEEIQRELPHLTLAQVYDAIAYFLDHRDEINRDLQSDLEETVSVEFPAGKF